MFLILFQQVAQPVVQQQVVVQRPQRIVVQQPQPVVVQQPVIQQPVVVQQPQTLCGYDPCVSGSQGTYYG